MKGSVLREKVRIVGRGTNKLEGQSRIEGRKRRVYFITSRRCKATRIKRRGAQLLELPIEVSEKLSTDK